jgi:hypothetical protein
MQITHNDINDPKESCHSVWITLSNGDIVRIYDNEKGFGTVRITRHDEPTEKKSQLTSSTGRAQVLGKKMYRNTIIKKKFIEIKDTSTWRRYRRRTEIQLTHFYPK